MASSEASDVPTRWPAALQLKDAAAYCGISTETFNRFVRPYVRSVYIASMRLWRTSDLDAFLASQRGPAL